MYSGARHFIVLSGILVVWVSTNYQSPCAYNADLIVLYVALFYAGSAALLLIVRSLFYGESVKGVFVSFGWALMFAVTLFIVVLSTALYDGSMDRCGYTF